MSYVRRPSKRSNGWPNNLPISSPNTGSVSASGAAQPPNLKPPVGSSSGPPGACITPSIETIAPTITFLIVAFSFYKPVVSVANSGTLSCLFCVRCRYESSRLGNVRDCEDEKHFIGVLQASPEMLQREPRLAMSVRVRIENGFPLGEVFNFISADHANHFVLLFWCFIHLGK